MIEHWEPGAGNETGEWCYTWNCECLDTIEGPGGEGGVDICFNREACPYKENTGMKT
jgi:hypothetical protein